MKVKLFAHESKGFPPTSLFNPCTRLHVKVEAVPAEGGWTVETEDLEAASSALKDWNFLLIEPAELQFPQVPNFSDHFKASDFKFKAAQPEEVKAGKYLSWPHLMEARRLAAEASTPPAPPAPPAEAEELDQDTEGKEETPVGDEATEAEELRAKLTAANVPFHHLLGLKKLRALVATIPAAE